MNFRKTYFLVALLTLGPITGFALAQNAPAGPVHFPAPATNGSVHFPVPQNTAPATAVPTVSTPTPAPVAAVNAPALSAGTSSNPAVAGDIRDIRGPIAIPYAWRWILYVLSGAAIAIGLWALWRLIRRNARAKAKLPFEIALERLEAARALMAPDTVREYAFTVSEIVRVYIEQRFGEKAAHRTTEEFLSDLLQQSGTPLAQHRRRLEDFLGHCDLIKFARWQLSTAEMESMHESARAFVLDTRPQPEPAKSAPKATGAQPPAFVPPVQPELLEAK